MGPAMGASVPSVAAPPSMTASVTTTTTRAALRSIAEQTVDELGGPRSILVRHRLRHLALDVLLVGLATAPADQRRDALRAVSGLVHSHAVADHLVLWPALRGAVVGGELLVAEVQAERRWLRREVRRLARRPRVGAGEGPALGAMLDALRQTIRDDDETVLPLLQQSVTAAQLRRLGTRWQLVHQTAPHRIDRLSPRPWAHRHDRRGETLRG